MTVMKGVSPLTGAGLVSDREARTTPPSPLRLGWRMGPLYALAARRICSPTLLDPEENWRFWTRPRPLPTTILLRHWPPRLVRRRRLAGLLEQDHAVGIHAHYDVGNAFYRLFLDRELMLYSCARFEQPDDTLETAQRRKAELLLDLLQPGPEHRVLDLGCGWGGMMRVVTAATGRPEQVHGFTLSEQQHEFVRHGLGLNASVTDFIVHDYAPAFWDRLLAVGSFEHLRPAEIAPFMHKLYAALKPGGRFVAQFFALPPGQFPVSMLALQLFFPGSVLSPLPVYLDAAAAAGFRLVHQSTDDYRPTLAAWHERFAANLPRALELTDVRTCNRYLVFFPIAWRFFDQGDATVYRLAWEKPR